MTLTGADCVALLHALFASFLTVGLALILFGILLRWAWVRNPWFRWTHLAATLFILSRVWLSVPCPLSMLEDTMRGDKPADTPLHRLAFRNADPQRFTLGFTVFSAVTCAALVFDGPRRRRGATHQPAR